MATISILPGDLVRDNIRGAPVHRVLSVSNGQAHVDTGRAMALDKAVLMQRGPMHKTLADMAKRREPTGKFSPRKFKAGDRVKITGNVPTKGRKGRVAMVLENGHAVTHDEGGSSFYLDAHLSHDTQGA